ncbi:tetratricopeptide repeat protein [Pectinatus frisingensis]|jgi:tetratricopeptide (TPR) repeat protein|uniref:tetratricopeptide repeat protein n=1 Tax=Pectinatus frisingensis TaxID=865 RepID=UPI0018C6213F|nr:tetratricopeptide repeat protein [Pectinatus frisingensis]
MNNNEFHELTHLVLDSKLHPPVALFAKGFDDWHVRARLAHFLVLPEFNKTAAAVELFRSVIEADVDENESEDIEEKVYALQHLSTVLRDAGKLDDALNYINSAIELAEEHDFLYKYILRGELWADRWNILARQRRTDLAADEVEDKIAAYGALPIKHISYLYYGYRFLAQLAAANFHAVDTIEMMKKALSYMAVPQKNMAILENVMSATDDDAPRIMREIDQATPIPSSLKWDI